MLLGDWSSGMIPASGAGGHEFDSRITPFLRVLSFLQPPGTPVLDMSLGATRREIFGGVPPPTDKKCSALNEREKDLVRTGTRTQNLLLRRQAPYPLGHTDNYEFC